MTQQDRARELLEDIQKLVLVLSEVHLENAFPVKESKPRWAIS